jgi:virginiamycin B lyase
MTSSRGLAPFAVAIVLAACSADASPSVGAPAAVPSATPSPSPPSAGPSQTGGAGPTVEASPGPLTFEQETFPVPAGSRPHDVAPATDGGVWYTAQGSGHLGWLDPDTGDVRQIPLGAGSAPHGVIVGPDGAAWVTDGGLNAIVRVDPETDEVRAYSLPASAANANLNTAAFDGDGVLWFTGQAGYYGSLDPASGRMRVFRAPRGIGPYGITATPDGDIYFSSLAGSYLGQVDTGSGEVRVIDPLTADAGLRRVWSDFSGRLWVSEWFAGQVGVYDPGDGTWREWPLPRANAQAYAVYVDESDAVWLTDFTSDAILRFDPASGDFRRFVTDDGRRADVRQLLGREGEVWGAESAADRLVVIRYSR